MLCYDEVYRIKFLTIFDRFYFSRILLMSIKYTLPTLLSISILTLTACQTQPIQNKQANKSTIKTTFDRATVNKNKVFNHSSKLNYAGSFNYSGSYATTHKTKLHYHQTLVISPITTSTQLSSKGNQHYHVEFSASEIRGRAGCSFSGTAVKKKGVLWLNVSNEPNKKFDMYLRPMQDKLGVEVFTKNFDERFMMMRYCRGGASLAGDYLKNSVTANSIGTVNSEQSIAEILQQIPKSQIKKTVGHGEFAEDIYDDYQIYDNQSDNPELLFTLTPKRTGSTEQKVNRVLINSPTFSTNKGIHSQSTYGEIRQAYTIDKIEPTREHIVLVVDDINAHFSIAKTELDKGWWNAQSKTVNMDKIPDSAKVDSFILWWNK